MNLKDAKEGNWYSYESGKYLIYADKIIGRDVKITLYIDFRSGDISVSSINTDVPVDSLSLMTTAQLHNVKQSNILFKHKFFIELSFYNKIEDYRILEETFQKVFLKTIVNE